MKIYNSLSNQLEDFKPLEASTVKLYVCGITPYDTTHLGHAFLYIFFDAAIRYLAYKGYTVNYTQNVTDIDDDILKRAAAENRDWIELGEFWTNKFVTDLKNLNIKMPTHYVKATDSIPTIITIISELIHKGCAYEKNGTVYFEVAKFSDYGKLSKYSREEMIEISKERGADPNDTNKKDPLDFVLWVPSKEGEPSWKSPWSPGRPGWHIECSAMNYDYLGEQIDIHGGGGDLIYPHHESEIAQSETFTGKKPFAQTWMHVAMLRYQGEKMSKSLGNLVMVSDLLKKYSSNAIRYVLLSHHYRTPWEFTEYELDAAEEKINEIKKTLNHASNVDSRFEEIIENDFNFPNALILLPNNPHLFSLLGFTA